MKPPDIEPVEAPVVTPESKKPHKKRCENCFSLFERKKHAPGTKRFCSDQCRKEFHHHGSAFGPLRVKLEKMIVAGVKELRLRLDGIEARVKRLESR